MGREIIKAVWIGVAGQVLCLALLIAVALAVPAPSVKAVIHSMDGCPPCARMEAELRKAGALGPQIQITKRHSMRVVPTTVIYKADKEVWRKVGYVPAADLLAKIRSFED